MILQGRIQIAPLASPTDGLLDVIIIKNGDLLDMIEIASKTLFSSRTKAMTEMSYVSPPPTTKYLLEAKSFRRAVVQEVTMQATCG